MAIDWLMANVAAYTDEEQQTSEAKLSAAKKSRRKMILA